MKNDQASGGIQTHNIKFQIPMLKTLEQGI